MAFIWLTKRIGGGTTTSLRTVLVNVDLIRLVEENPTGGSTLVFSETHEYAATQSPEEILSLIEELFEEDEDEDE